MLRTCSPCRPENAEYRRGAMADNHPDKKTKRPETRADLFRARAREVREQLATVQDADAKALLLQIAERYEALAKRLGK